MSEPAFRIGVDARILLDPPCGIRRYCLNLLRALLKINDSVEYVLFSTENISEEDLTRSERVRQIRVAGSHKALLRPWWESFLLPKAIKASGVDLFFSPLGTVPPRLQVPVVATVHDLAFKFFPHIQPWRYRRYWKRMLRRISDADMALAVSHSTKEDMLKLELLEQDQISVIWEGIDHAMFKPSDEIAIERVREKFSLRGDFVFFVGTREPRKNLKTLLKSMEIVNSKRTINLALVGSSGWGPKDIDLDMQWLKVLGKVTDEELVSLYSCATLFAFPSLYEGFGLPVLEAMSCGAPVICSNISSMPEIVGQAALQLPPEDELEWAEWIDKLLDDPDLRSQMRSQGFEQAVSFTWEKAAEETLKVFFETIYQAKA